MAAPNFFAALFLFKNVSCLCMREIAVCPTDFFSLGPRVNKLFLGDLKIFVSVVEKRRDLWGLMATITTAAELRVFL